MEPQRTLMDPNYPDFTIGLTLNGNRSDEFIKGPGDVEGEVVEYYTSIEKFTTALESRLMHMVVNNFVVLPPPPAEGQVVPLFKVILRHENNEGKVQLLPLLFKKHDLYYVGFKSAAEIWYEYKPQPNKRTYVQGSTNLPFDCSYMQRSDKHSKSLSKIYIDNNILQVMFQNLRGFKMEGKVMNVPYYKLQEFCDMICISICEATRFKKVRRYIIKALNEEEMKPFGKDLEGLIRSWSLNSKTARRSKLEENKLEQLKADVFVILY